MSCARYERWMWDALDGRLSAAQSQALQAHLQACAHCQRRWESAHASYRVLHTLPRRRAPENLTAQVRARLQSSPAPAPAWGGWKRAALAPALGLLAALAWWGGLALRTAETPAPPIASQPAESWVELHEQLEIADWSPTPTANYFISTGYTR
ncbi:MAG: zf-HC2 domain-containing protein [Fimbriimonadales bacterium]|nr:zf-HC2 domain-containing protein [Fimbriimonadales bacterium]